MPEAAVIVILAILQYCTASMTLKLGQPKDNTDLLLEASKALMHAANN